MHREAVVASHVRGDIHGQKISGWLILSPIPLLYLTVDGRFELPQACQYVGKIRCFPEDHGFHGPVVLIQVAQDLVRRHQFQRSGYCKVVPGPASWVEALFELDNRM